MLCGFSNRQKKSIRTSIIFYQPSLQNLNILVNFTSDSPRNVEKHIRAINKLSKRTSETEELQSLTKCREKIYFYSNIINSRQSYIIHSSIRNDILEERKFWPIYPKLRDKVHQVYVY